MKYRELEGAISHGAHSPTNKYKYFVRKELAEQLQAGHVVLFPLAAVHHLHKLRIYPIAEITQTCHKQGLIYNFSWSRLSKLAKEAEQKELMRFGKAKKTK